MNLRPIAWSFCLAVLCLVGNLSGADDPFDGTWKLNIAKSESTPPQPKPQSGIITVRVEGNTHHVKTEDTTADGKTTQTSFSVKLDDTPAPVTGASEYDTISAHKTDERSLVAKVSKDGKEVAQERVSVSKDGKVLTNEISAVDEKGTQYKWIGIYDKQ